MACNCRKSAANDPVFTKRPDQPCVFCAHKHIAAAKALYDLESGYRSINKSNAIGQLILAAWHYNLNHHHLAMRCRDIWLEMEKLHDVSSALSSLQNAAWQLVLRENNSGMITSGNAESEDSGTNS